MTRALGVMARMVIVAGVAVLAAHASVARAQIVPSCDGQDTGEAEVALAEGDRAVERAALAMRRHRSEEATAAWTEALEAYDLACAAGAGVALERRAIPLFRLGHADQAAESLDHYLAVHPLDSLDRALARRIQANQRAILRRVATLVITPMPAHAAIIVDGVVRGQGLLRVRVPAETSVVIEARAADHEPYRLASTYGVGEHMLEVRLEPTTSVQEAAPTEPTEPQLGTPAPLVLTPAAPVARRHSRPMGLLIGGLAAGVVGLAGVSLGVTSLVFGTSGTDEVLFGSPEWQLTNGVILLGVGLGLVTASIIMIVVYAGMPEDPSPSEGHTSRRSSPRAQLACALWPLGARCAF
ncbi:MAG: hypothetical protein K1X94_11865 [Sandaracinaceae bacterium]|nr:hypothetical protein [Sandaracinaceae bacterium]